MSHKQWLDNEYAKWVEALKESTVFNFGYHPMVKRMLGEVKVTYESELTKKQRQDLEIVEYLGGDFRANVSRMVYYAKKVLEKNPTSIDEIGGGVGQFYAVLKILGYNGHYYIHDLLEVQNFQKEYLIEVGKQTGIDMRLGYNNPDYCVSFYAWGEFDDELKKWYLDKVIKKCPHGLIVFNPHSGASDEIGFECEVSDEDPLTSPGNKLLVW